MPSRSPCFFSNPSKRPPKRKTKNKKSAAGSEANDAMDSLPHKVRANKPGGFFFTNEAGKPPKNPSALLYVLNVVNIFLFDVSGWSVKSVAWKYWCFAALMMIDCLVASDDTSWCCGSPGWSESLGRKWTSSSGKAPLDGLLKRAGKLLGLIPLALPAC